MLVVRHLHVKMIIITFKIFKNVQLKLFLIRVPESAVNTLWRYMHIKNVWKNNMGAQRSILVSYGHACCISQGDSHGSIP